MDSPLRRLASAALAAASMAALVWRQRLVLSRERAAARFTVLEVDGMNCADSCGAAVQRALAAVPGVIEAKVKFETREAQVRCAPGVTDAALVAAVTDAGFSAKPLEIGPKHLPVKKRAVGVTTVRLDVQGMMCENNCGAAVKRALESVDEVSEVSVNVPGKCAIVLGSAALDPEELARVVSDAGFEAQVAKVMRPKPGKSKLAGSLRPTKPRHTCIRQGVPKGELEEAFGGVLKHYHEQQLQEYSRYKNWTQSCYMECHEQWSPQVPITEELRDVMLPLLDRAKEHFATWYKDLYGLNDVEVVTLNSFITKYIPVEGKDEFGKHVDSAKADGSLILALPTDEPHDWPGLKVWDGKDSNGKIKEHTLKLEAGDICCLDSLVWHHGLPISVGKRYVAVCFYRCKWKKVKM